MATVRWDRQIRQGLTPAAHGGTRPTGTKILGTVGTFFAGFGDTRIASRPLGARDLTGANSAVDKCSRWYRAERYAGYAWEAAYAGTNAVQAVSAIADWASFSGIGSTGRIGQAWLSSNLGGESQVALRVSQGLRVVDQLA